MLSYANKTALVTGASSGIGEAFAEELARRGARVLLTARSEKKLEALADRITSQFNVDAHAIPADLSSESSTEAIFNSIKGLGFSVDLLINNAGFGTYGPFESHSVDREHQEIMVNVASLVRLTHLALPGMLAAGGGIIMNVASTAAFQPLPYMAVYAATKAFVLSFSEALWAEYRGRNVRVLAVCPGATETNFFAVVGSDQAAGGGKKRPVAGVVAGAFRALERGKASFIDGGGNFLRANVIRLAPRRAVVQGAAAIMRPRQHR